MKGIKFSSIPTMDLVLPLTLITFMLNTPGFWQANQIMQVFCIVGLIFPVLQRKPDLWAIIGAFYIALLSQKWEVADNHIFLKGYWALSLFMLLRLPTNEQSKVMANTARAFIAISMGFSVLWKVLSHDYLSTEFFEYTLLTDGRFEVFTHLVAGISLSDLALNRELVGSIDPQTATQLISRPGVENLALFMTWWTVVIESAIALFFVLPDNKTTAGLRNYTLLLFAVSTYSVATVKGFAWLLMAMGIAQTKKEEWLVRGLYVLTFLLISIYTMNLLNYVKAL